MPSTGVVRKAAALIIIDSSGARTRTPVHTIPFQIGRNADNNLVLRDSRVSRNHARIVSDGGDYFVEDLQSSHGTWVNGVRVTRQPLRSGDKIEFGTEDSYSLLFTYEDEDIRRLLEQFPEPQAHTTTGLGKLRALVEVARAVRSSLSTRDVLSAVVEGCLAVTNFDRGFLFLKKGEELEVKIARDRNGRPLTSSDLDAPIETIQNSLQQRRDLLTMHFDPRAADFNPSASIAALQLRSVVCVPLVRIRSHTGEETQMISAAQETIGLIYLDSRQAAALDLSSGNQELLQTLALEASTILENARLLEEERAKQRIDEELEIARNIQQSLLPQSLPATGWFRARGFSIPSHAVGGDYFDVRQLNEKTWSSVVADVSGKGVSSALLASLLQGAFLAPADGPAAMQQLFRGIDTYLYDRTGGEKYATLFFCTVTDNGRLLWLNAGHCCPILVRANGTLETLETTGMPLGMLGLGAYDVQDTQLRSGDKIVAYSDGLSDAADRQGRFYGMARIEAVLRAYASASGAVLHEALRQDIARFTAGTEPADDITLLVLDYTPER